MIRGILNKIAGFASNSDVNPFHDYLFGKKPRARKEEYLAIWEKVKRQSYPVIDQYEQKLRFYIDSEWFHKLALHTQVVIKKSEICYQHGRLLYATLSNYVHQNGFSHINILETGTARGFSSLCMAKYVIDQNSSTDDVLTRGKLTAKENSYPAQIPLWRTFMTGFVELK